MRLFAFCFQWHLGINAITSLRFREFIAGQQSLQLLVRVTKIKVCMRIYNLIYIYPYYLPRHSYDFVYKIH